MDSTLLFSTTARFCDIKQQRNCSYTVFVFFFDSNNKLNDLILLEKAHVILMTFLVKGQNLIWNFLEKLLITQDDYQMLDVHFNHVP